MARPKPDDTQRNFKNIPDACIPCATSFTGDINTKAGVRIDGSVKGNVTAAGNVVIGPEGMVEGQVAGRDVSIAGAVTGNVAAAGVVQLNAGAKLLGDLEAVSVGIEEGATFKGKCSISPGEKTPVSSSAKLVDKPAAPVQPTKQP
jgi:cytoskeletal protein CcmA (bactofilin family)